MHVSLVFKLSNAFMACFSPYMLRIHLRCFWRSSDLYGKSDADGFHPNLPRYVIKSVSLGITYSKHSQLRQHDQTGPA